MTDLELIDQLYLSNEQISILEALTLFGVEAVLLCVCRIVSHSVEPHRLLWCGRMILLTLAIV